MFQTFECRFWKPPAALSRSPLQRLKGGSSGGENRLSDVIASVKYRERRKRRDYDGSTSSPKGFLLDNCKVDNTLEMTTVWANLSIFAPALTLPEQMLRAIAQTSMEKI